MSDFSYPPISEMSAKNTIRYSCPKTGISTLFSELKNVDLDALAGYYHGRSYLWFYTACGSHVLSSKEGGSWRLVIWMTS